MTKRIFVVDDERIIADSLATILSNSGYQASAFYDLSLHCQPVSSGTRIA